uniref:Uncharacterized protein n=1 Tax=Tanacetum cinerariifolium TaxID=118510 RepID=A0A6L2KPE0_TANCI|nr:hypothetical protein [Tanacetum cinerariifolium]
MHYPDMGSPSFGRDHFGAHGDSYHAGSIVPSSRYEIGGSSAGFHGDDFDSIVHLEDCVQSNGDEMVDMREVLAVYQNRVFKRTQIAYKNHIQKMCI